MRVTTWRRNLRHYWHIESRKNHLLIVLYAISQMVTTILDLAVLAFVMPLLSLMTSGVESKEFSDSWLALIVGRSDSSATIVKIFLLLTLFYVVKSLLQGLAKIGAKAIRSKLSVEISDRLFHSYLKEDYEWHTRSQSPVLVRNVSEAYLVIDQQITPLIVAISESVLILSIFTFLILIQPVATLSAGIFVAAVSMVFFKLISRKVHHLGATRLEQDGSRASLLSQSFSGIREVKLLNLEEKLIHEISAKNKGAIEAANGSVLIGELTPLVLESTIMSGVSILVVLGALGGVENSVLLSFLAVFSIGCIRVIPSAARVSSSFQLLKYGTDRVSTILNSLALSESIDTTTVSQSKSIDTNQISADSSPILELADVSFEYQSASSASLSNIKFSLNRGTILGLTGISGSGKTTLMDITMGLLHPTEGSVAIFGSSQNKSLICDIAYVSQEVFLFNGSIRENICMGSPNKDFSEDAMNQILKMADLDGFIKSLPSGLESTLDEGAANLSGGQRQRIGIARALAQFPKLLVLDEATSSLDDFAQKRILSNLRSLEISIIMISHDIESLRSCDRLLLLDKGCLVADGSPIEVLAKYRELHLGESASQK